MGSWPHGVVRRAGGAKSLAHAELCTGAAHQRSHLRPRHGCGGTRDAPVTPYCDDHNTIDEHMMNEAGQRDVGETAVVVIQLRECGHVRWSVYENR